MARVHQKHTIDDSVSAGPIGSDAAEAQQRRRNRSVEYQRLDDQYASTREMAAQVILYRTRRHLTQEQLAHLIGTSASQLSRIESGRYMPSGTTLQRLAEVFERPLHITFGESRESLLGSG